MSDATPLGVHQHPVAPVIVDLSRAREQFRAPPTFTVHGTYAVPVAPLDPSARLMAFSAFVRRVLDQVQIGRGWNVEAVAEQAGIGVNTLYHWRRGPAAFPEGEKVRKFCVAVGVRPEVAFAILWPADDDTPSEPIPLGPDDDLVTLARRLMDPSVSAEEKFHIRETIKALAQRSPEPKGGSRRRASG